MVKPVSFGRSVCSDPDDDKFLEAAVAADADYIVSGDVALLSLKNYRRIRIVRPAQFFKHCPTSFQTALLLMGEFLPLVRFAHFVFEQCQAVD